MSRKSLITLYRPAKWSYSANIVSAGTRWQIKEFDGPILENLLGDLFHSLRHTFTLYGT